MMRHRPLPRRIRPWFFDRRSLFLARIRAAILGHFARPVMMPVVLRIAGDATQGGFRHGR